jgi:hypothetical protein
MNNKEKKCSISRNALSVNLGPLSDETDDWELSFRTDGEESLRVRLSPRSLNQLYYEVKDISADSRQTGHSAECALCGQQADLEQAIPDGDGEPCHRECWADAFGAPEWFTHYG